MYARHLKRCLDVLISALLLMILSPLLLIVAVLISAEDGGPALFRQERVGREGLAFTMLKFRSMPVATPHLPSAAAGGLRVTRIGKFIRRTNIDELPQLVNVLRGDMSIVGPRPALPSQTHLLELRARQAVMSARPGLTGLAQINSYQGMPETEKVEWDGRYVRRITPLVDLSILLRTFGYLLRPPPVY
jgi:O-antigen biosynthesis protein WbqP